MLTHRRQRAGSTLKLRDQLAQACASLLERPGRTLLSVALVAVGAALIVIVTTLGDSAEHQVSARFDALRATTVEVGLATEGSKADSEHVTSLISKFPVDADKRLTALRNVRSAGTVLIRNTDAEVALTPATMPTVPPLTGTPLVMTDTGLANAADLTIKGRWFDDADLSQHRPTTAIGQLLAQRLGVSSPQGSLIVDGVSYSLVAIVDDSPLRPDLLNAVIIPRPATVTGWDVTADSVVIIRSAPGAARQVADQAARQLYPEDSSIFSASAPEDPSKFRQSLEGDTRSIMRAFALAGGCLGTLATLLVWWSSVSARRGAIGLWRALGATRPHVFRMIITECLAGGVVAGLMGSSVGIVVVAGVCLNKDWELVMSPWLAPVTILGTTLLGGLAGCLPAWQATRMDPVESLRTG